MEQPEKRLQTAVRELRTRLNLNQVQFAARIDRAINTVSRYESQIAPKGEALIPYAALAIRSGFTDLARIFKTAIIADFGSDFDLVLSWRPTETDGRQPPLSENDELVEDFRAFITARDLHPVEEIAREALKETLLYYRPRAMITRNPKKTA